MCPAPASWVLWFMSLDDDYTPTEEQRVRQAIGQGQGQQLLRRGARINAQVQLRLQPRQPPSGVLGTAVLRDAGKVSGARLPRPSRQQCS